MIFSHAINTKHDKVVKRAFGNDASKNSTPKQARCLLTD